MAVIERVLASVFVLAALYPLWRLLAFRQFRRGFPTNAVRLAAALGCYVGLVGAIAVWWPWALRGLAVATAIALLFTWWRARPGYGRRRRLPPGQLKILSLDPCSDPSFYRTQAERYGNIFKTGATHPYPTLRPVACIVDHELGLDVLKRYDDSLVLRPVLPFSRFIPRGFLRHMEHADHRDYGKLFHSAMSLTQTAGTADLIATIAHRALDDMAHDCARNPVDGIRPHKHLDRMLFVTFASVFFGVEPGSEDFDRLQVLHKTLNMSGVSRRTRIWQIARRKDDLMEFLRDRAHRYESSREGNGTNLHCVIQAIGHADPSRKVDDTVLANLAYMLEVSRFDVLGLLIWVLKMLGDHPQWITELRGESTVKESTADSIADRIVRETLRMEQSEYLYRRTTRNIEVGDYVVPSGWVLRICIRDAHRGPSYFKDPDQFSPCRFAGAGLPLTRYAPFGLYRHMCIGAELTLMICRIFISEMAHGFEFRTIGGSPAEHPRFHWEPNGNFRLLIQPRT